MKTIKYLSLFSGIGGFEYGMEQSKHNFRNIGASEVDKYATSIYTRHFPKHRQYGDVKKIDTGELEDFELLVGGFPCQAFSIAGKEEDLTIAEEHYFLRLQGFSKTADPHIFFSKMLKVYYLMIGAELSRQSLGSAMNSGMMYHGRFIIPKTMVLHRTEKGYTLKDILEKNVEKKYFITEKRLMKLTR